jgi:hypothetical protein
MWFVRLKMTVTQDFQCQVDEIEQEADVLPQKNQVFFKQDNLFVNCVRVFLWNKWSYVGESTELVIPWIG